MLHRANIGTKTTDDYISECVAKCGNTRPKTIADLGKPLTVLLENTKTKNLKLNSVLFSFISSANGADSYEDIVCVGQPKWCKFVSERRTDHRV
jgi:hypothetical protein